MPPATPSLLTPLPALDLPVIHSTHVSIYVSEILRAKEALMGKMKKKKKKKKKNLIKVN